MLPRSSDVLGERRDILLGRAFDGLFDRGDFQHHRRFIQLAERDFLQNQCAAHAAREAIMVRSASEQATAGIPADQAALLEHANAFAHRRAIDAELPHQFGLRSDRLTRTDSSGNNLALDRFRHHLVGRRDVQPFEAIMVIRQGDTRCLSDKG